MKKKFGIFASIVASLCLVFLLAGCGEKKEDPVVQVIPTEGIWKGIITGETSQDAYLKFNIEDGKVEVGTAALVSPTKDTEGNDFYCSIFFNAVKTVDEVKDSDGNVTSPAVYVPVVSTASFGIYNNAFKFDSDSYQSYDVEFEGKFTDENYCTGYIKIKKQDGTEYSYDWIAMPEAK